MMKMAMSPAAAGLVRGLLDRAAVARELVRVTSTRSTDWRSLMFEGERHEIGLRIAGPAADLIAGRLLNGIGEAEFTIKGHIVADIAVAGSATAFDDGAIGLEFEALTIVE